MTRHCEQCGGQWEVAPGVVELFHRCPSRRPRKLGPAYPTPDDVRDAVWRHLFTDEPAEREGKP